MERFTDITEEMRKTETAEGSQEVKETTEEVVFQQRQEGQVSASDAQEKEVEVELAQKTPEPSKSKDTKKVDNGDSPSTKVGSAELNLEQYPPHDGLDIEIDKLVYVIEEHSHALKNSLVKRYMNMRNKWHEHEGQRLNEEKKRHEEELALKENELEREKWVVHTIKGREQNARKIMLKSVTYASNQKERLRNFSLVACYFKTWHNLPKKRRLFLKALDRIDKKFSREALKSNFQFWRKWTRENVRSRIEEVIYKKYQRQFDEERDMLTNMIANLEIELESTKNELSEEISRRVKTEKDMKQSFMRGLCAMNIEAMSMMKKGSFNSISSIIDAENGAE